MAKELYLSGEGVMMTKQSGGDMLKFGTIQNLNIATSATFKELFAGSGLFPVASRAFEKSIECSCEMASFAKDFIELSQGLASGSPTTVERPVFAEKQTVTAGVATVDKSSYKAGYTYVTDADGNKLTKVAGAPASGEYQESTPASGELTFNADMNANDVYIDYVYNYDYAGNADDVEALVVAADVLPATFELFYECKITEGGVERGVEIVFFQCKPTVDMKLVFQRDFNVPNFTFRVVDPKRPDGKIGHYVIV